MKKILPLFLIIFTVGFLVFNFKFSSNQTIASPTVKETVNDGTLIHKANWEEALLEFGDEDDTLDSLDYVPDFLR